MNIQKSLVKYWKIIFIAFCSFICIFSYFRFLHNQTQKELITKISSLLEAKPVLVNTKALAKSILDLKHLDLISCASISENKISDYPSHNISRITNISKNIVCNKNKFIKLFEEGSLDLKILNDSVYRIIFQFPINWQTLALELMSYLLLTATVIIFIRKNRDHELKTIMSEALISQSQSQQVSHDIRSPLTVLNLIANTLTDIPENQRITIRTATSRINDIANQLLHPSQQNNVTALSPLKNQTIVKIPGHGTKTVMLTIELLPAIVDLLASKMRMQFRDKNTITIETDFSESYGAFAEINHAEFQLTLANIINNSVESMQKTKGKIIIAVRNYSTKTIVSVRDNGSGISSNILSKFNELNLAGNDYISESTSEFSLFKTKKTIESFGAKFVINSREGLGAEIRMEFPKCATPNWFVPELKLNSNQIIVALDDDSSILEIWKQRIKDLDRTSILLHTYTSKNDFTDWVKSNPKNLKNTLFLMDYELLNQKNNGLDLIEEFNLNSQSILVTSRYDEPAIRTRCALLKVKQIPKGMAPFVPIEILDI